MGERVVAVVDAHQVAGAEVVGLEHAPHRRLGRGRGEAVVGVVARRRGPIARRIVGAVVDEVLVDGPGDGEDLAGVADRRHPIAGDLNGVVGRGRLVGGHHPQEFAIVGGAPLDEEHRDPAIVQLDVDRVVGVMAAPADEEGLLGGPAFAAGRLQYGDVLGRALGGLVAVAVGAEIDEGTVGRRLRGIGVRLVAPVDGRRLDGVVGLGTGGEHRQAADAIEQRGLRSAVETAVQAPEMEVVVFPGIRPAAGVIAQDRVRALGVHELRIGNETVGIAEGRGFPVDQGSAGGGLPESRLARAREVEQVVVAVETGLCGEVDLDPVARVQAENVVAKYHVARIAHDLDGVARGGEDRVVLHHGHARRLQADGLDRVVVDQVVADLSGVAVRGGAFAVDAAGVRIDGVAPDTPPLSVIVDPPARVVVDPVVFYIPLKAGGVDPIVVSIHHVPGSGDVAASELEAAVVGAVLSVHRIAIDRYPAAHVNAFGEVVVYLVAQRGRQVGVAHRASGARGIVRDVDPGVVAIDLAGLDPRVAGRAQLDAVVAVRVNHAVADRADGCGHRDAVFAVVVHGEVLEGGRGRPRLHPDAVHAVALYQEVAAVEVAAAVAHPDAPVAPVQGQVAHGHKIGAVDVEGGGPGKRIAALDEGLAHAQGGAGDHHAFIVAQPGVGADGYVAHMQV